jgi:hypothetical protein
MIDSFTKNAYFFFKANAGYRVGHRAQGAFKLANAHNRLKSRVANHLVKVRWEYDENADLSWADQQTKDRIASGYYTVEGCSIDVLQECGHWDRGVASVWGVVLESRDLQRAVIEAELALEAGL